MTVVQVSRTPFGVGAQVDLGVAQLLYEEAISGLNLCLTAEMPDKIGYRQRVSGLDKMASGDEGEANDRARGPSYPASSDNVLADREDRHRMLRIGWRKVWHLEAR